MRPSLLSFLLLLALGGGALTGCNTTDNRIQEKAVEFSQLSPTLQDAVRRGKVGIGFSREMTYMALGKPNTVEMSSDGRESTWTYLYYNNAEDGSFAIQNKKAISSNIMGGKMMVFGGEANGKNATGTKVTTLADDGSAGPGDGGTGWRTIAGKADMDRGEVAIPDPTVRQKTAREMMASEDRQDLLVKFYDGRIVDFKFVIN